MEKIKDMLENYNKYKRDIITIDRKIYEIKKMHDQDIDISTMNLTGMPSAKNKQGCALENQALRRIVNEFDINKEIAQYEKEKTSLNYKISIVNSSIDVLEEPQKEFIKMIYMNRLNKYDIMNKLNIELRTFYTRLKKCIEIMEEK